MKFYAFIAAGVCTISLGFDPDPDPGTGFTPNFWISAGYLKKLRADFDEFLRVDSCGGTKEEVHVLPVFVCLSVCLLARLLKNACMDLDEMLRVDTWLDMDELIIF